MADQHDPVDDWLAARFAFMKVGPRRSLLFYAAGAVLGLGLAGFALFTAKGTTVRTFPPEDVALVNGRQILRSDFLTQIQVETGQTYEQTTQAQRRKVLGEMIDEELLVQRGVEVDLAASDPDVRAALVSGVNLQVDADVLASQPTPADLFAYYNQHIDKYSSDGVMKLRDLVMPLGELTADAAQAKAQMAADAINHGAALDPIIAQYALKDSDRIDRDDNFDFAVKAKLGPDIFKAAAKLMPGQASTPVKQPDGLHIIVMVARKPSVRLDYAQAQDNVWQDYKREAREKVERANLNYLKGRADITVAPEYRK